MEPSAGAGASSIVPLPRSPSRPTTASGQRSGSTWRSCVKPKPKHQKAALLFPVISSRTSNTSDNGSSISSSSSSSNVSTSSVIPGSAPGLSSAALVAPPIQVVYRATPPAPLPAAGRRSSQLSHVSQASLQNLAKHQAKITNYFVKKGPSLLESAPPNSVPDDEIEVIEESESQSQSQTQSQSLQVPFEPRFASIQVDFDFDVTRLEPRQGTGQTGPQSQSQHQRVRERDNFSLKMDAGPEEMPAHGAGELSLELFTSDPEDEAFDEGKEEPKALARIDSDIEDEDEDNQFGPRSQSPSLIPVDGEFVPDAVPMQILKTPERPRPPQLPRILRTPSPTERSPLHVRVGDMTMDLIRNFDRIPARQGSPPSPGYAYKPERAIRKKDERARLQGWDCDMCRDYYEAIASQLTAEELQKLKDKCSRHRYKYAPNPGTPPGYWDVDFPSTQECIQQGYMGIGVRTPPAKAKLTVSRGSQSSLFSTPTPPSRSRSAPSPKTPPAIIVEPASPVTPISQSPRPSPVQVSRGRGKSRRSTSSGSGSGKSKGDSPPRRSGSRSSKGWKGIKTTTKSATVRQERIQRMKKFKPTTPKPKHHPQPTRKGNLSSPCKPVPLTPPKPKPELKQGEPTPVPSTSAAANFGEDFKRALAEFDNEQETMLDSEDQARFCPLSPSLTPKWPRSNKIIVVPQLAVGSPPGSRVRRKPSSSKPVAAEGPSVKKLNL